MPIGIKDNIATTEGRTSCGSRMLEDYRSPFDATVVDRLRREGAILIGHTNCDEFAMGSSSENCAFGAVRNPWDTTRVPGGSSGGSAAAVGGGLVPAALGSDTGGSIRQPAAFCGCVGLKPSYGRVSRYGLVAFGSSLDQIGPFTRTSEDAALLLEVIGGIDPNDSTSASNPIDEIRGSDHPTLEGLTIGIPAQYRSAGANDPAVDGCLDELVKTIESAGGRVIDVDLPMTDVSISTYYVIAPAEASSNLARYDGIRYGYRAEDDGSGLDSLYARTRDEGFGPEVKRRIMLGTYMLSSGYYDAYYKRAPGPATDQGRLRIEPSSSATSCWAPRPPSPRSSSAAGSTPCRCTCATSTRSARTSRGSAASRSRRAWTNPMPKDADARSACTCEALPSPSRTARCSDSPGTGDRLQLSGLTAAPTILHRGGGQPGFAP